MLVHNFDKSKSGTNRTTTCGASYEYWFKDGVGFVKTIRREYDLMEPNREIHAIWNLIEYHIE